MTGASLLAAAIDELYSQPMAEFTARRGALATAARKAGNRVAAAAIGALRKPTLSADTVNRLVRTAPAEVGELLRLGGELRAAEQALNATELRKLSDRRRRLVSDLAQLAFDITGQTSPSATVRDEVTGTLNAALADEQVANRLASGALVTQARWDGFGSTSLPDVAAVPPQQRSQPVVDGAQPADSPTVPSLPTGRSGAAHPGGPATTESRPATHPTGEQTNLPGVRKAAARTEPADERADDGAGDGAKARQVVRKAEAQRAADSARAEQERRRKAAAEQQRQERIAAADQERRDRIAAAEQEVVDAERARAQAQEQLAAIDRRISELNLQLAHQRQLLASSQRTLREAENRRRAAQLAATRAGATPR